MEWKRAWRYLLRPCKRYLLKMLGITPYLESIKQENFQFQQLYLNAETKIASQIKQLSIYEQEINYQKNLLALNNKTLGFLLRTQKDFITQSYFPDIQK